MFTGAHSPAQERVPLLCHPGARSIWRHVHDAASAAEHSVILAPVAHHKPGTEAGIPAGIPGARPGSAKALGPWQGCWAVSGGFSLMSLGVQVPPTTHSILRWAA